MYTLAAATLNVNILHRYLEKGQRQNEADSIHSVIEKATFPRDVYVLEQWYDIIKKSRAEGKQYTIVKLREHMLDFHTLATSYQNWS